jgi:ABC-type cobalamin transport system permease subunit
MMLMLSAFSLFLIAACVFVPMFVIALIMVKSALRALTVAALFAMGSVLGFVLAAMLADWAVGHGVGNDIREVMSVAFAVGGAVAGGVIAVWILERNNPHRPSRRP